MTKKTYTVLRGHHGDKTYAEGDTREAVASDVEHLVQRGVLREKASQKVKNKAGAPVKNKAD